MDTNEIVKKVISKRELKDIDDNFVKSLILELSKRYKGEILFKESRKILRLIYGMYKSKELTLEKHLSTRDRLSYYKEIYENIFKITGKPNSILDLGCGINPLSYQYLSCKPEYYACDIGKDYIGVINDYFNKNNIKGNAFIFDLINGDYNNLPKADVCFLFKVLESLELIKRDISKDIIKKLNCNYIIVSFAKKALGGRITIRKKGRSWFRRILNKLDYKYEILDIGDEIFYVIKKDYN